MPGTTSRANEREPVPSFIRFENVDKTFGSLNVIEGLNLEIAEGEFLSLLGPSGSGKTTTLMMLAGFERVSGGRITMDGNRIDAVPAHKRGMGVVFQNYALFPHMSVAENIAFPLQMRKVPRTEIRERVATALDRVRLGPLGDRRPSQLSGGQQQRVALARALVFEPRVILLDEPLGALDKNLREEMQLELRALHRRLGLTFVFVTHDQSEALTMSDRIAVFDQGRIAQIGTPEDIYDRPQNLFVAGFVGETNLIPGQVCAGDAGRLAVRVGPDLTVHPAGLTGMAMGAKAVVSIRPESIHLAEHGVGGQLRAVVADQVYQGDHIRLLLEVGAVELVARVPRNLAPAPSGRTVAIGIDDDAIRAFPA